MPGQAAAPARASVRPALVVLVAAIGLVTACSGPDPAVPSPSTAGPRPSLSPPEPSAPVPSVPVHDAALGATPPAAATPAPVRLVVPDVSIDMAVDPVGVQDDGEMQIPPDANRAGWYRFGPAPSDVQGATVLAAHVDSRLTGVGQFARLRDVAPGATLTLTTADGVEHAYTVVDRQEVAKDVAPVAQWFDRTGAPRLVLVTCGGTFRRDIGHYEDNVVVTAEPVDG